VGPSDSILSVKQMIEAKSGVPAAAQKLVFSGVILGDDAKTVATCELPDGASITAVLSAAPEALRPRMRDLITRIGDRSNLILDNVLASYYLTDVVLNRLPDILDRLADLTLAEANSANDPESRAQFLVGLGSLVSDVEGMDASLVAAENASGGATIRDALDASYKELRAVLAADEVLLKSGKLGIETARVHIAKAS
jgi:hypothetical protein